MIMNTHQSREQVKVIKYEMQDVLVHGDLAAETECADIAWDCRDGYSEKTGPDGVHV